MTTSPALEESISYEPAGVVAHVSAWNYPYFVGLNSIVPALLAGNSVVYKPSELASLTGLRITDLLHAAGVPVDVFQAAIGAAETGAALVESDVDVVCFTGSYATGRRVAVAAAERLARVQLELGGKDPAYVCDDVDVARVAPRGRRGRVLQRRAVVLCHRARLRARRPCSTISSTRSSRRRAPTYPATRPTTTPASVRSREPSNLRCSPRRSTTPRARGAKAVLDGGPVDRPGNFFAPVVLVDVDHSMAVMREESFGPVIGLQRVGERCRSRATRGRHRVRPHGRRSSPTIASARSGSSPAPTRAPSTGTAATAPPRACRGPVGGHSGLGVSLGEAGIQAFLRPKAWHLRP